MSRRQKARILAVLAVAVVMGLYPLQRSIAGMRGAMEAQQPELLIQSGPLLQKLSMGYAPLLADIYWTRVIQYFGTHLANQDTNLSLLAPLLNITVTLDPQLKVAYQFGSIFLAEAAPVGAGRPDQAIALVRRGIKANPNDWEYWYELGSIDYWNTHEYVEASKAFAEAGKLPGSPEWMTAFAAAVAEKGNSLDTSRLMWAQTLRDATDPRLKKAALYHLQELQVEKDLIVLGDAASMYREKFERPPATIDDLVNAGILAGKPRDPAGYEYKICAEGSACIDSASPWANGSFPSNKKD
jgi:tetratricopeptide (TPR) repeat protein